MKRSQATYAILATTFLILGGACSSDSGGGNGNGGASGQGSGGTSASGGTTSSGGTTASEGGKNGSGGASGTGGLVGSGGKSTVTPGAGGSGAGGASTQPTPRDAGHDVAQGTGGRQTGGGTGTPGTGGKPIDGGSAGASGGGAGGSSDGCGSDNTTSPCSKSGTTCSLDVSGTKRVYYVQLPSKYDSSKQYPLIFQFHPWGGTAEQALTMYNISKGIPDAIYVTPQGLDAGSNGPGWANTNGQDIAFTKAMLADVQGKYCVDKARIFSTGFSYGGMFSFAIGCEMSDVFRAIAPMSGSLYSDMNCKGTGPHIAMWGSHGTSDSVVPIADGRKARDKILQQNHCGTDTKPVDPSPCVAYQGCDDGYPVTWCEWDGNHGMPSFGTSAITAFFKQF